MRRTRVLPALVILGTLVSCNLPLTEAPTPFPIELAASPTPTEPAASEPLPTSPAQNHQINPQTVGQLHLVGEFPQDLTGRLDWAPDSRLLALTTIHGAGIFDVQRLLKLRPLLSDVTPTSLALSPDGATLVTGGKDIPESPQDTVTVWRVDDATKLQTMIGHGDWVNTVDYSPTGELVASGSDDSTVRIWRVDEGTEAMVLRGHTSPVTSVAFASDGLLLASGSLDGTVRLWRVADGAQLMELPQGELGVTSVAFSPDGITLAAASADGIIRLFAPGTGAPLGTMRANSERITDIDFSPDGTLLASSGDDHAVRFWELGSSTQLFVLAAHSQPVLSIGFAPNGEYVASGSIDGSVRIWGLGEPLSAAPAPEPAANPIEYLAADTPLILQQIQMFSEAQGWAIGGVSGDFIHLLRTEDGGSTWLEVTPPQAAEPNGAERLAATATFHDPYTGWVIYYPEQFAAGPSDSQVVRTWRTSDGGVTWAEARPQAAMDINDGPPLIDFADDQYGWILNDFAVGVGQRGFTLLRTDDSGFSWEPLAQPPESLSACRKTGLEFVDPDHGWIAESCPPEAGSARLLSSKDGGESFEAIALPAPPNDPEFLTQSQCVPHSPRLFSAGDGLLAVECAGPAGGYLYRTSDDGQSWISLNYPGGSLQFITDQVGWALSRRIYKTVDGGQNWVLIKNVNWLGSFSFVTGELGWAIATNQGAVALVRTTDGAQRWAVLDPKVAP